jgi:hypothetical protein
VSSRKVIVSEFKDDGIVYASHLIVVFFILSILGFIRELYELSQYRLTVFVSLRFLLLDQMQVETYSIVVEKKCKRGQEFGL